MARYMLIVRKVKVWLLWVFVGACMHAYGQNIRQAEYFIDHDPGVGKGISISAENLAALLAEGTLAIDVGAIDPGPHRLVVRIQDPHGTWSLGVGTRFFVDQPALPVDSLQIAGGEYFFNDDPGIGNGMPLTLANPLFTSNSLPFEVPLAGLTAGTHLLVVRLQDTAGRWGPPKYSRIVVSTPVVAEQPVTPKYLEVVYFINDPESGLQSRKLLGQPTASFTFETLIDLDTVNLPTGRHHVLAKALDHTGRWSLLNIEPFDYCRPEGVIAGFSFTRTDQVLHITDESANAVNYIWDMGNGDSLFLPINEYSYPEGGTFEVCQTVYSFCDTSTVCRTVVVPTPRFRQRIPDVTLLEDTPWRVLVNNLNNHFEDPDDQLVFSTESFTPNIETRIVQNNRLEIRTINHFHGTGLLRVSARGGNVQLDQFVPVTVLSVNDLPHVATTMRDVAYDEDTGPRVFTTNLSSFFSDPDGDTLRFNAISDNPNIRPVVGVHRLSNGRDTLRIFFDEDYFGSARITVTATDDSLASVSQQFRVTILPMPDAPKQRQPLPAFVFDEDQGEVVLVNNLNDFFRDPDGGQLTYQMTSLPEEATFRMVSNRLFFRSAPDFFGEIQATLLLTNGHATTAIPIVITVRPVNDAPRIQPIPDITLCPQGNFSVNLNEYVFDVDGLQNDIRYSFAILSRTPSNVPNSALQITFQGGTARVSTTLQTAAAFQVMLMATDLQQAVGRDTFQVEVLVPEITLVNDTLRTTAQGTYTWFVNGQVVANSNRPWFVPTGQQKNYQVEVRKNGCTQRSAVMAITNAQYDRLANLIGIYPNPTSDKFYLEWQGALLGNWLVRITDLTGRIVQQKAIQKVSGNQQFEFSLQGLPKGMYFLELGLPDNRYVFKIVKE